MHLTNIQTAIHNFKGSVVLEVRVFMTYSCDNNIGDDKY